LPPALPAWIPPIANVKETNRLKTQLLRPWFLVALLAALALGFAMPSVFLPLAQQASVRNSVVATVLFLMALPLETRAIGQSLQRPGAALLGSAVNMGLLPLIAWALSLLLHGELAPGMMVAASVPCTLASAAVWTRRAGGNDAAAILVTLLTNATCFLTTPAWLLIAARTHATPDASELIGQLLTLVVLPMALGQLARLSPDIARWSTAHKNLCGTLAQIGILTMVLLGATQCGDRLARLGNLSSVGTLDLLLLIVLAITLHLVSLVAGFWLAGQAGMTRPDRIAVAIAGSQKTLMVGVHLSVEHFGGLAILPMVVYHVVQLVLDTLIADRMREAGERAAVLVAPERRD
jgi:sodium/bile acid cotransporter 7